MSWVILRYTKDFYEHHKLPKIECATFRNKKAIKCKNSHEIKSDINKLATNIIVCIIDQSGIIPLGTKTSIHIDFTGYGYHMDRNIK